MRVVLAGMDYAQCEQRKRGRILKRKHTRAYHSLSVGESNLFDFQLCTGKRGAKQPLATRPRSSVLAPCSRLPSIWHELSRSERETTSKCKIGVEPRAWPTSRANAAKHEIRRRPLPTEAASRQNHRSSASILFWHVSRSPKFGQSSKCELYHSV
jgi:hypothetical protein